jgi:hypothetical protein
MVGVLKHPIIRTKNDLPGDLPVVLPKATAPLVPFPSAEKPYKSIEHVDSLIELLGNLNNNNDNNLDTKPPKKRTFKDENVELVNVVLDYDDQDNDSAHDSAHDSDSSADARKKGKGDISFSDFSGNFDENLDEEDEPLSISSISSADLDEMDENNYEFNSPKRPRPKAFEFMTPSPSRKTRV